MLLLCQAGYEGLLARELAEGGWPAAEKGPGWVRSEASAPGEIDLAFPQLVLTAPQEIRAKTVNALAEAIAASFASSLAGERIDGGWPCVFGSPAEVIGLGRWTSSVEASCVERIGRKLPRIARLATAQAPRGIGPSRGLFAWFADFDRVFVSRSAWRNGQQRMADDPEAPSRSYLKVEEAYGLLGKFPGPGETVVDLGAAPGGWTYSAARRGARVVAVDNGPLKGGAAALPGIEHRKEDAFGFVPPVPVDWLFCDMVEDPRRVIREILAPWLSGRRCRRWIVNLKFGRVDPLDLLGELRSEDSPLMRHAAAFRVRHLHHDREELTVVGELR